MLGGEVTWDWIGLDWTGLEMRSGRTGLVWRGRVEPHQSPPKPTVILCLLAPAGQFSSG